MKNKNSLNRKAHFLGTKIRNLRKRNRLTMEDLSARCIKIDAESAPSVVLFVDDRKGKTHSQRRRFGGLLPTFFQKNVEWFLDDIPEEDAITPSKGSGGGISGMALEPNFLFLQRNTADRHSRNAFSNGHQRSTSSLTYSSRPIRNITKTIFPI